MKKKLFTMMTFLVLTGMLSAQNALTVTDFTLPQNGGSIVVNITLGEANVYTSYQFKVETPAGIGYVVDGEDDVECVLGTGHTASHGSTAHWNGTDRVLTVGVISTGSTLLTGQSVSLSIPLAATSAEIGTQYNFTIKDITFIQQNGTKDALSNVTFKATVGAETARIVFDEGETSLPDYTEGESANVRVKRSIKANSWSTICLPFAITAEKLTAAFGAGVEVKDFTSWSSTEDPGTGDIVGITIGFTSVTAMEANHPYLIKVANAITAEEGFTVDGVDIDPEDEPFIQVGKSKATRGYFTGTYVANTIVPEEALFVSNDKFYYSNGSTKMKAFRGYFELADVLTSVEGAAAHIMISDETTGIADVRSLISEDEGEYYSIAGQKVLNPQKGIYIKNGKKVIIK